MSTAKKFFAGASPDAGDAVTASALLLQRIGGADEVVGLVEIGAYCYVEKSDHHFVVGLIAPADGDAGIGIVGIIFGIVVPGDGLENSAGGQRQRLGEAITELPVEIVIDAQQRLGGFVGAQNIVLKAFSTQVHVREETEQDSVVGQRAVDFHAIIVHARRDYEAVVGELQREDALLRRICGEDDADAGLICSGVAMRHVMHLENEIGPGGDEFRHAFGPVVGTTSGGVHQ